MAAQLKHLPFTIYNIFCKLLLKSRLSTLHDKTNDGNIAYEQSFLPN